MIACAGLLKRFPDRLALNRLSLEVGRGEVAVLLGHNGSGKTTLLRVLAGRLLPDGGMATIDGLDPALHRAELSTRVGASTSAPSAWALRLSALDNLELFGVAQGLTRRAALASATDQLEQAALFDHRHRPVGTYSQGMRARLAIARALLTDPQVLLLDEPTAGLDSAATERLLGRLHRERGVRTVVMSTHSVNEAVAVADVAFRLEAGRVAGSWRAPLDSGALLPPAADA